MKNQNYKSVLYIIILASVFVFSCTPLKKLKYIQTTETTPDTLVINKETYKLKKGDNLYIDITTSNMDFRNFISSQKSERASGATNNNFLYLISYQVDDKGYIYVPFIDPILAYNNTIEAVQMEIQKALSVYITDVTVSLKLVNFNITVLGEVYRPGQHFSTNNQLNLFEAIGMAGDLTIYGNRKNIKVMRKLQNGDYQIHKLDITRADIVSNEYFVLQPNDIIYIEPLRTKLFGLGTLQIGTVLTTITTLILIINTIK